MMSFLNKSIMSEPTLSLLLPFLTPACKQSSYYCSLFWIRTFSYSHCLWPINLSLLLTSVLSWAVYWKCLLCDLFNRAKILLPPISFSQPYQNFLCKRRYLWLHNVPCYKLLVTSYCPEDNAKLPNKVFITITVAIIIFSVCLSLLQWDSVNLLIAQISHVLSKPCAV